MAYLNKKQTKELKDWKCLILEDSCKLKVVKVKTCINEIEEKYITIDLIDSDGDFMEDFSIQLDEEYENNKILDEESKKIRSELCRKMDMYTKEIEIINCQV